MAKIKVGNVITSKNHNDIFMGIVKVNDKKCLAVYDMREHCLVGIENEKGSFESRYEGKTLVEDITNGSLWFFVNRDTYTEVVFSTDYIEEFRNTSIDERVEWFNKNSIVEVFAGKKADAYEYFKKKYNFKEKKAC